MTTSADRVLWKSGDPWSGDLSSRIDEVGILVITHRGTAHRLFRQPGRHIVWTRAERGGPEWRPIFPVIRIGTVTPCGFSVRGVAGSEWHASSKAIYIATGDQLPDDDLLDQLIARGTRPVEGHPPQPCQAVYCDMIADSAEARRNHLADLFRAIVQGKRSTE